jgi:hypothetical protein
MYEPSATNCQQNGTKARMFHAGIFAKLISEHFFMVFFWIFGNINPGLG